MFFRSACIHGCKTHQPQAPRVMSRGHLFTQQLQVLLGKMTPQNLQHTHDAPLPAPLLYLSTASGSYSVPHLCAFSLSPRQLLLGWGTYTQRRPRRPLSQRGRGEDSRSPRQRAERRVPCCRQRHRGAPCSPELPAAGLQRSGGSATSRPPALPNGRPVPATPNGQPLPPPRCPPPRLTRHFGAGQDEPARAPTRRK